jgi:hypothetical protein
MCYRDLYDFIQDLDIPVQIPAIRHEIANILPNRRVAVIEISLDVDLSLGFYLSHRNEDTLYYPGIRPGSAVVVLSKDLEPEWRRFVELKELMHLFDDPLQSTMTAKDFEQLLAGLCDEVDPAKMSPQHRSEHESMWMALSLLCPENRRTEVKQRRDDGLISDKEIADIFGIPERFVINLCSENYKRNIQYLLDSSK